MGEIAVWPPAAIDGLFRWSDEGEHVVGSACPVDRSSAGTEACIDGVVGSSLSSKECGSESFCGSRLTSSEEVQVTDDTGASVDAEAEGERVETLASLSKRSGVGVGAASSWPSGVGPASSVSVEKR